MADEGKYLGVAQKTLAVYHRAALDILIKVANSMKMRLCHLTSRGLASWTETSFWKELLSALLKTMPRLWMQLLLLLTAESLNEDDSEWDDDKRPLTQPSLKRSLRMPVKFIGPRLGRPHRHPREPRSINVPQPFKQMRRPRYPPRHVPRENTCSKCSCEIFVWRPLHSGARIQCKVQVTMSVAFMLPRLLLP